MNLKSQKRSEERGKKEELTQILMPTTDACNKGETTNIARTNKAKEVRENKVSGNKKVGYLVLNKREGFPF